MDQAKEIFDEVILGVGVNPEKNDRNLEWDKYLPYSDIQIMFFDTLVTDLICSLEVLNDVTLIIGVRDSQDLVSAQKYIATVKDLKPDIKHVIIMSEPKYHHISSSMIRGLIKFGCGCEQYLGRIYPMTSTIVNRVVARISKRLKNHRIHLTQKQKNELREVLSKFHNGDYYKKSSKLKFALYTKLVNMNVSHDTALYGLDSWCDD